MNWHVKNEEIHNQLGKREHDQNWANRDEEEKEYVW
jgi:hypothetical protein